jgi:hypothetical protein
MTHDDRITMNTLGAIVCIALAVGWLFFIYGT